LGVKYLQTLFKEPIKINIIDIVRLALFFPHFVDEASKKDIFFVVTAEEIKEVLFSFQKDKSPSPNGWTLEFFSGFFYFFGKDLLEMVEESRRVGQIHAPFNATFIALNTKTNDPQTFDDFRPISLCNCIYKIVVKIITKCLQMVLSETISKEQFGFLEGRQIHEAIGVAQEGLHSLNINISKCVILNIDLSKAYDRVFRSC
jgi:hypothetical protein